MKPYIIVLGLWCGYAVCTYPWVRPDTDVARIAGQAAGQADYDYAVQDERIALFERDAALADRDAAFAELKAECDARRGTLQCW